jgi:hypothetical protein
MLSVVFVLMITISKTQNVPDQKKLHDDHIKNLCHKKYIDFIAHPYKEL